MIEFYVAAATALIAFGAVIGVILVVSLAIHRDERAFGREMREIKRRIGSGTARLTSKDVIPSEPTSGGVH